MSTNLKPKCLFALEKTSQRDHTGKISNMFDNGGFDQFPSWLPRGISSIPPHPWDLLSFCKWLMKAGDVVLTVLGAVGICWDPQKNMNMNIFVYITKR